MKPLNEQINAKFIIQAKRLARYTQLIHQILPIECRNHVDVANIRNQNLMLITDSPVWTTRLRQLSPQILQHIRENSPNTDISGNKSQIIHHIQISTRYSATGSNQTTSSLQKKAEMKQRPIPRISSNTSKLLSQSAESIDDEQLKSALLRVAKHVAGKTKE